MSQKGEKYARRMERRVDKLEQDVAAITTEQTTQGVRISAVEDDLAVYRAAVYARELKQAAAEVKARFGTIDAVVCNAGIADQKLFQNITDADWMRMLDVNLMGTVRTIRAVLPEMLHNHKGSIVTVSSMWGECGASCESHYSASKAAIIGLSKSLAQELGPSNIRVNCIAPGVIDTDMNAMHSADTMQELADQTPLGRVGAAAEVADSILYLCSDKSSFITGQVLGVTGGF